tara:strand:- start:576 stop:1079 length:504 start_codon:yes stop_codon:yes gene_type:complete
MFLKNTITGIINEYANLQGGDWAVCSEQELSDYRLEKAKDLKRAETKTYLNTMFANPLLVRAGNGGGNPDYYVKPSPEYNIFLAGFYMADEATKDWRAFDIDCNKLSNSDGSPLFLQLTKDELIIISSHYEDRKTQEYNQRDLKLAAINALTTVVAVEAFDVSEVIV